MASNWLQSTYTKIIIAGIVGFLGIAAGIYTGFALSLKKSENPIVPITDSYPLTDRAMKIIPGDKFPSESYSDTLGNTRSFETLIQGKDAILVFSKFGCGPCQDLMRDFREKIAPQLRSGTEVVFVIDKGQIDHQNEYANYTAGMKSVYVDWDLWKETYGLFIWPTIIGVDNYGFIKHSQYGYVHSIEQPLADYFFME